MTSDYERRLWERMDRFCLGASKRLSEIETFPEDAAEAVLREILETGCLSQNAANIEAARREILRLPPDWVAAHLPKVVPSCLFQEPEWQEWEFRRAAELLEGAFPEALAWLIYYAKTLNNPEVDEAIEDFLGQKETEDVTAP
jgi:hypothetical protein